MRALLGIIAVLLIVLSTASASASPPPGTNWIGVFKSHSGQYVGWYKYDSSWQNNGYTFHEYDWTPPAGIASGEPTSVIVRETTDAQGNKFYDMITGENRDYTPVTEDNVGDDDDIGGTNVE